MKLWDTKNELILNTTKMKRQVNYKGMKIKQKSNLSIMRHQKTKP
jgi:hypothetical protein